MMVRAFVYVAAAALLAMLSVAYAADTAAAPAPVKLSATDLVGKSAPAFSLKDTAGKSHKLADLKGKIVVLDWFNYGCPVVKKYYENKDFVASMNSALQGQKDVVWLSVVSSAPGSEGGDPAEFKTAAASFGKVNTTLWDTAGTVGHAYGASATPTVFVIDAKGKIVYAGAFDEANGPGEAPKGTNLALAAVKAARAGKSPAVSSTKPFGCSVKYASK
jgi:peroxiredoxin